MSTVRVYDLATKFRLTTKEVLERLQAAGIEAVAFGSSVDETSALEALSRPAAKIPVRMIRPGSGTAVKPTTRRTTRAKTTAPKAKEAATAEAAAKPRVRKKPSRGRGRAEASNPSNANDGEVRGEAAGGDLGCSHSRARNYRGPARRAPRSRGSDPRHRSTAQRAAHG